MKLRKKLFFVYSMMSSIIIFGNPVFAKNTANVPLNPKYQTTISIPFNAIDTIGTTNYQITVGSKTNTIEVIGDSSMVSLMHYKIEHQTLHLFYRCNDITSKRPPPLLVILHLVRLNRINQSGSGSISVNYLKPQMLQVYKAGTGNLRIRGKVHLVALNTEGPGNVDISHIRTSNLFINIRSSGVIKLTGRVALAKLNFSGPGRLKMFWINSGNLRVRTAGSGKVTLAGIAGIVNAYAYDNSHLNLRFLRARTLFVKSYNNASVDVWAQDNLFALANNNSNIYYFYEPWYKSRMMEDSGTVLSMTDIPGAIVSFQY